MSILKKSKPGQTLTFNMVLTSDHSTPSCGLTPTVTLSKNGGTPVAPAGVVTESKISAPTLSSSFTGAATTGGHLAGSTTYYYKITATNALGETNPSTEQSYTVPGGTNTNLIALNWTAVPGANGYKVYRGTTTNSELLLATVSGGGIVTYIDNSATTPTGAINTTNTTSGGVYVLAAATSDVDTLGELLLVATGTSSDRVNQVYTVVTNDSVIVGPNGGLPGCFPCSDYCQPPVRISGAMVPAITACNAGILILRHL